jgi:hypothetical protein
MSFLFRIRPRFTSPIYFPDDQQAAYASHAARFQVDSSAAVSPNIIETKCFTPAVKLNRSQKTCVARLANLGL